MPRVQLSDKSWGKGVISSQLKLGAKLNKRKSRVFVIDFERNCVIFLENPSGIFVAFILLITISWNMPTKKNCF